MAQDPDGDDNDDGTFTKVDKYFAPPLSNDDPNMGTLTSSAGLFLKNPTKTTTI